MKICHIIWEFNMGGAESMLVDIINEQSKTEKVDLVIVNNLIDESLISKISSNITIHKINRKPKSRNLLYPILINLRLFQLDPDIIHLHQYDILYFIFIKNFLKAKTCLTVHDTRSPTSNLEKFDLCFAISHSVKDYIDKKSSISSIVVYNGINSHFYVQKQSFEWKQFKIVQIGSLLHTIKGQNILLYAITILVNEKKIKNFSIDFIGDGPSKAYLENLAIELNIKSYCNFKGVCKRDYIYKYLAEYDLLIQPSVYEGFGLTVAEGLAAKVPVLVSDIEGPMEIIEKGKYGYFFEAGNFKNCADKILKIMNNYNTEGFLSKIDAGYNHVKNNFSIIKTANKYLSHYKTLKK